MRKNEAGWPSRVIGHYLNGSYSAPGSSTGVPVSYFTLIAPGAHSPYIQKVKVKGEVIALQAQCNSEGG